MLFVRGHIAFDFVSLDISIELGVHFYRTIIIIMIEKFVCHIVFCVCVCVRQYILCVMSYIIFMSLLCFNVVSFMKNLFNYFLCIYIRIALILHAGKHTLDLHYLGGFFIKTSVFAFILPSWMHCMRTLYIHINFDTMQWFPEWHSHIHNEWLGGVGQMHSHKLIRCIYFEIIFIWKTPELHR